MRKKFTIKKCVSTFFTTLLIAAMCLCMFGCGAKKQETEEVSVADVVDAFAEGFEEGLQEGLEEEAEPVDGADPSTWSPWNVVGEGETMFYFLATVAEDDCTYYEVHTDATTVGEALLDLGLIDGEDSEYGLYVKEVNGVVADYDVDGTYWAFYIDGEYAMTGVDSTDIVDGATYEFVIEQ